MCGGEWARDLFPLTSRLTEKNTGKNFFIAFTYGRRPSLANGSRLPLKVSIGSALQIGPGSEFLLQNHDSANRDPETHRYSPLPVIATARAAYGSGRPQGEGADFAARGGTARCRNPARILCPWSPTHEGDLYDWASVFIST
jgi:hypothetical protein